ncbi:uncharacterized protein LOC129951196 [Eupeodes corollae]|uniref:uncharacterized protein LOC129951196 n=1 Tax=Eupeodes corollae TaxID=290404 RepID=UPI00249290CF|nr:uncharacterized protein LOC129951196 [Eupeodes corollae]
MIPDKTVTEALTLLQVFTSFFPHIYLPYFLNVKRLFHYSSILNIREFKTITNRLKELGAKLDDVKANVLKEQLCAQDYLKLEKEERNLEQQRAQCQTLQFKIQFTVEKEESESITFLDVKIYRENDRLSFDWYQKDTASERLVNFRSNQAKHIRMNTASNLINKVFALSDSKYHSDNEKKVTQILIDNSFPINIIRNLILRQKHQVSSGNKLEEKNGVYKSVVYVPKLSENFKKVVAKNNPNVNLAYKSNQTVASLFTCLKTKTDKDRRSDVVYKINCKGKPDEPCNLCYIGTTKQLLRQRMANHKSDISLKNPEKTALACHTIETGHQPDFEGVQFLATEKHTSKRYTLETLHIINKKNNMNRKQDTQNISAVYCSLVSDTNNSNSLHLTVTSLQSRKRFKFYLF